MSLHKASLEALFAFDATSHVPAEFTFGVEIEIWSPYPRDELAEKLQERFDIDARVVWFTHQCTPYWKVLRDSTLVDSPKGQYGMELVSPILHGGTGIQEIKGIVHALRALNVRCDASTGLHVHVGRHNMEWTLTELQNICTQFIRNETFFDAMVPVERRGDTNSQLRSNANLFIGCPGPHIHATADVDALIKCVNSNGYDGSTRYFKLNVESLRTFRTIEFRQQVATVDWQKAVAWVAGILAFCKRACLENDTDVGR
ncbi:uncharacterized protein SPPG_08564 [Spizellomyces punctatus DAOM BR117]|uniref:Amidoligase enzyme n=1 Tax=Spizellomyces punctatus (strain DAOM BR117) TaxID=645134 RepID=A0A0L0H4R1_SPIPD|nr:uncharacterized protein SPPG_08564 [Spizellomyces punctatus DAOM BR117]KNC95959.1 hypothetical protein SPPG_08564 [Spizellomyces punctatus DAOM BR117]|eukprot:XP_016603999.1 hypothetical protein SPPG_08564 [Spizellomyces punctatus DAOM BR117]